MSSRSVEQRDASFYDSYVVDFSPGGVGLPQEISSGQLYLFGEYGRGEKRKSNVDSPGMFPGDQVFRAKAVELTVACADEQAYNLILRTGMVEFVVGAKSMWSRSFVALRHNQGDSVQVDTTRGIVDRHDFENPIIIPARQNFYWNLQLGQNAVKRLQKFERLRPPGYSAMIRVEMIGTLTRDIL